MSRVETLIFEQAERSPCAIAVQHNDSQMSYWELRRLSLGVCRALQDLGLEPGGTVGICRNSSEATIPIMLGIWSAGGVIVPINPNTPAKVLQWMTQSSSLRVIITESSIENRVITAIESGGQNPVKVIAVDDFASGSPLNWKDVNLSDGGRGDADRPDDDAERGLTIGIAPDLWLGEDPPGEQSAREDTSYVFYTSGSEGRPKGVIGCHRSLVQYLEWHAKEFSITEQDRLSQVAPLSFDFSLKELLVPLIRGARLCIADKSIVIDPKAFVHWVEWNQITVMCCVPTLVRSIIQMDGLDSASVFASLRSVLISGEMLRWDDIARWREHFGARSALCNLYGPTESTIIKLFYQIPESWCPESVNVPVGKPIDDADVLILDELDQPCGVGQIGEIMLISQWVARGYVNGHQNGGGSFCRLVHNGKLTRAYRTGDLGRLLTTGDVELVGRKDRQVKIRGYRIELDEIESVLADHPEIDDVAVVLPAASGIVESSDAQVISCYFTGGQDTLTVQGITDYAKERLLPQVMSLLEFWRMDKLPLTANGKIDRLKLASLNTEREVRVPLEARDASQSAVRERISAMWREVLSVSDIDPDASFFELGGDSITAIRLLRKLREELEFEVRLGDLYDCPSISGLSERVGQLVKAREAKNN